MKLAMIYMASGFGRRFGSNKLLVPLEGQPLYQHGLRHLLEAAGRLEASGGFQTSVIVASQYEEILEYARSLGAGTVHNPYSAEGITASIRLGTKGAPADTELYLYFVADQPYLSAESVVRLVEGFVASGCGIGSVKKGSPCIFAAKYREELLALTGDRGGRQIIRRHPEDIWEMEVPAAELRDIDLPEDMPFRIAVIGAGGKTTAVKQLAAAGAERSVLLTTTTHMYPVEPPECRKLLLNPTAEELMEEVKKPGILCAGSGAENGKMGILPDTLLEQAVRAAKLTVYEADGAKRLPLKLHRPGEPVILAGTDICLVVAGLSALGKPVGEAVHCYERNPAWAAEPEKPVGPEKFLYCVLENVRSCELPADRIRVLLNQADCLTDAQVGEQLVCALRAKGLDCRMGSLQREPELLRTWVFT
ncbi:MAG: putative selenium-dependent hydroxylase accessory protein YqeC [Lachnospiraceae bacterium]|nr:putative selenium-dependent hydroxylase accessory protein YqeC [Lachnospiraceae bacterium]